MNPIELMKKEIEQQSKELKIEKPKKIKYFNDYLFVGSGDSFVSGLIASYESNFSCLCMDPAEIIINPIVCNRKRVCFISISGKTKENILAAKKAKRYCKETIAITADPNSNLAKNCMRVIKLKYQQPNQSTAGTLGFILTTMTVLSLINRTKKVINIKEIYRMAEELSKKVIKKIKNYFTLDKDQSILFLSNSNLFPVSCYGSLKVNEVFGLKSFAFSLEYFCHSPLFSISNKDTIIIFSSKNNYINKKAKKLNNLLNTKKFNSFFIEIPFNSDIEILLMSIFFIQLFVYGLAREKKLKNFYFLDNRELLKISSDLIY